MASSSEDEASSDGGNDVKLGDKLFDSEDGGHEEAKKAAELNTMSPELI